MPPFSFATPTFNTVDLSGLPSTARHLPPRPSSFGSRSKKFEVPRPPKTRPRKPTTVKYNRFGRLPEEHLTGIVLTVVYYTPSTRESVVGAFWLDPGSVSDKLKQGHVANIGESILETFLLGRNSAPIIRYQEHHVFTGESVFEPLLNGAISISTRIYGDCIKSWCIKYSWDRGCRLIQPPRQLESPLVEQEAALIQSDRDTYGHGWRQPKRIILMSDYSSRKPEISREESCSTLRGDRITQESIPVTTPNNQSGSVGIWVWKQDQGRKKDWRIHPLIWSRAVTQEMLRGRKLDPIGYWWNSSCTQLPMAYLMGDTHFREIRRSVRCTPPKRMRKESKAHEAKRLTTRSYMTERHVRFITASKGFD